MSNSESKTKIFSKKYIISGIVMVAILVVTILILLKDYDIREVVQYIRTANILYLLGGVLMMVIYQFCIGESIRILINAFSGKTYPAELSHKTSYIGFYFNAITPSSSGGQPMEIYYMHKRGVNLSHSTIIFLLLAIFYSLSSLVFAVLSFIFSFDLVTSSLGFMRYFTVVGVSITIFITIGLILLLVKPRIVHKLARGITAIGMKLRLVKKPGRFLRKLVAFNTGYSDASSTVWKQPALLGKLFVLHLIQLFALYCVPWFVAMALGGKAQMFLDTFSLQAVLYISSDFFPTPGAVGITETGFITMFQSILPKDQVMPAMLLTRGINLYGFLVISAFITMYAFLSINRDNKKAALRQLR